MAYRGIVSLPGGGFALVTVPVTTYNPIQNLVPARIGLCNICRCKTPMEGRARCYDCYQTSIYTPVHCAPTVQECASMYCHNQANSGYRFCQKCYNETKACNICKRNKRSGLGKVCGGCKAMYRL